MKRAIILVEQRDGQIRKVTYEAIAAAKLLSTEIEITCLLISENESADQINSLIGHGADRIGIVSSSNSQVENCAAILEELFASVEPDWIILGHTGIGRDIAPRLAVQLQLGLVSDCIQIEKAENDQPVFTRPIYAGKAFEKVRILDEKGIITIRPNNFSPVEFANNQVVVEKYEISQALSSVKFLKGQINGGTVDLSEARVIISGGRGVKSESGFGVLYQLANTVGGAVGASRGACDAAYCDYSLQIGQTGKVVTPDLYIACGISGAIQHLAGMSNSKCIVAINKDPDAAIFQVADYGIVGDLFEVVPLLTTALSQS